MADPFTELRQEQERNKRLPQCACCGKLSDGSKKVQGLAWLCGTDYDLWLESHEAWYVEVGQRPLKSMIQEFINRVQAERRNAA